ncbi:sigma-70 family RNA polymerase sigma factor [Mycetocola spongiae]|uniref:sigma-70 family RNA polymerase sigma factor n=1 Tax=Mycetocola spongiae TaxID=2859226 RepID=UPI001CF12917|nr:sigma-70 family RNA polymerase sigma factor [Mycetocola spongiae]UCR88835.1 sigma-70 family RNA polymerase sigma factor [Mycetocola spongiae]
MTHDAQELAAQNPRDSAQPDKFKRDQRLLQALREGDTAAAEELYRLHIDAARALAYRLTGSSALAEDIASEAFTRVLEAIDRGSGPTVSMDFYLATSVRSVVYNQASDHEHPVDGDYLTQLADENTFIESTATENSDLEVAAVTAFNSLGEADRNLVWSRAIENIRVIDLAETLGISPTAVSVRYNRARARFRDYFLRALSSEADNDECRQIRDSLGKLAIGTLPAKRKAEVERHLAGCPDCTAVAQRHRAMAQRFLVLIPSFGAGTALAQAARTPAASALAGLTKAGAALPVALAGAAAILLVVAGFGLVQRVQETRSASEFALAGLGPTGTCLVEFDDGHDGEKPAFNILNESGDSCVVTYSWQGSHLTTVSARAGTTVLDAPRNGTYSITIETSAGQISRDYTVG